MPESQLTLECAKSGAGKLTPPEYWLASFGPAAETDCRELSVSRDRFSQAAVVPGERARVLRLLGNPGSPSVAIAEGASCRVIFDGVLHDRSELSTVSAEPSEPPLNDADLILRAYQRWGQDVLRKLKGMFALCIWDARQ